MFDNISVSLAILAIRGVAIWISIHVAIFCIAIRVCSGGAVGVSVSTIAIRIQFTIRSICSILIFYGRGHDGFTFFRLLHIRFVVKIAKQCHHEQILGNHDGHRELRESAVRVE